MDKIKISASELANILNLLNDDAIKDTIIKNILLNLSDSDKIELKKAIQDTKQLSLF